MKLIIILLVSVLPIADPAFRPFSGMSFVLKLFRDRVENVIEKRNIIDTRCALDLKTFVSDLQNFKLWAVKMMDASGKLQPGILNGNLHQFGSYDECLAIQEEQNGNIIKGQYCSVFLIPNGNLTDAIIKWHLNTSPASKNSSTKSEQDENTTFLVKFAKIVLGICIPKSCSIENLQSDWNYIEKTFNVPFHLGFDEHFCTYKDKPIEPYSVDIYIFVLFGIVLVLVLTSTVYDIYLQKNGHKPNIYIIFSIYTNTKNLLSANCGKDDLTCLYGIKALSMMWVIIGNDMFIKAQFPNTNTLQIITEWRFRLYNAFFMASYFAVDTFFVISGLLVVYIYLKFLEKNKIALFSFYIHRLFRLWPTLIATILFYIGVIKFVAGGPYWPFIVKKKCAKTCYDTWTATLFFFSNYMPKTMCVDQSWSLSIDTQFYILAPLILLNIKKYRKKVFIGIIIANAISMVYTFVMVYTTEYMLTPQAYGNYMDNVYYSTLSRAPAWLIGVSFGYFLYHHHLNNTVKISKKFNWILWTVSLSTILVVILYHHVLATSEYNSFRTAFFNAIGRPLWSLAICYIIYSCCTGCANLVNKFLSHPVFIVLGKLNYSIYLTHLGFIYARTGRQKQAAYFSNFEIFYEFIADFVIILICSAVLYLVIEIPFSLLLKNVEKRGPKTNTSSEKGVNTNSVIHNYVFWFFSGIKSDYVLKEE